MKGAFEYFLDYCSENINCLSMLSMSQHLSESILIYSGPILPDACTGKYLSWSGDGVIGTGTGMAPMRAVMSSKMACFQLRRSSCHLPSDKSTAVPVSYTHLTLPTNREV